MGFEFLVEVGVIMLLYWVDLVLGRTREILVEVERSFITSLG